MASCHSLRSTARWTFPDSVRGSAERNTTRRGYRWAASRVFTRVCSCSTSKSDGAAVAVSTTNAVMASPRSGSGVPTTADSATAGCAASACSTSNGPTR